MILTSSFSDGRGRSKTNRDRDVVEVTIANEIAPDDVSHHSKTWHIKILIDPGEKFELNHVKVDFRRKAAPAGQSSKIVVMAISCVSASPSRASRFDLYMYRYLRRGHLTI